ncbi:MAG: hypothetical protein QOD75_849 [Blastocatellia bacterium]|nr:hypothetical protein [Blastocatellia bacterium]
MLRLSKLFSFTSLLTTLFCVAAASPQQDPGLLGTWLAKDGEVAIRLTLDANGTGTLDEAPIKYQVRGAQLIVDEAGTINRYSYKLEGVTLVVSGGDLDSPLIFTRQGNGRGLGGRRTQGAARPNSEPEPKEKGLVGRWQSSEATVQINENGTLVLNGETLRYRVAGNVITLANNEGELHLPFQLAGNTLTVQVGERRVVYKRLRGDEPEGTGAAVGGRSPELFGKWCYMSNVNASNGGRLSNRCFTLYENGTYDYYSETSSSGPVASSASQESDSGTWTATANTITRNSRSLGTATYSLEKRNHPKTGDPMIVLDGDAYVTYAQRRPW